MDRRAMLASVTLGLAAPTVARATTEPGLAAAGWTHGEYDGIRPASFRSLPDGVAIEGQGAGSFVWRRVRGRGRLPHLALARGCRPAADRPHASRRR
ncbi:hypothetical protein [Sediminicoccus sp. BL-A-41-H5]|uniref:hypothetical protein n=1 Tax=Sediminicoccus sp. BL-A-41-H5 TaxID=3421106 RepID=UPI003D675B4F